jgi:hypothetical protein
VIFHGPPLARLEWEGIALLVKSFIRQAESERVREKGRDLNRDEGLER